MNPDTIDTPACLVSDQPAPYFFPAPVPAAVVSCALPPLQPRAALNATGGTKPMFLAAFEVFRDVKRPVSYVERDNRLLWLHLQPNEPSAGHRMCSTATPNLSPFYEPIAANRFQPLADDGDFGRVSKPSTWKRQLDGRESECPVVSCKVRADPSIRCESRQPLDHEEH